MEATTVQKLLADLKNMKSPIYPVDEYSNPYHRSHNGSYEDHADCGWTNMLHEELDRVIGGKVEKVIDASHM